MRIALASSSTVAIPILNWLLKKGFAPTIITAPDKPTGRGQILSANDFAIHCQNLGISPLKPATDEELNSLITSEEVELVVTVAYGKLIKKQQLTLPKYGWINVHFSLLPRWRGAAPVQFALLSGDEITGITVFQLEEGMDTGPIYSQDEFPIPTHSTSGNVLEKLSEKAVFTLEKALEKIALNVPPTPQATKGVTYAPKITKLQGKIDWSQSAENIVRHIHAFNPWPLGWTTLEGKRFVITSAQIANLEESFADTRKPNIGEIYVKERIYVACSDGFIELLRVKPEGKREMSSVEWLRGIHNSVAIQLGT